MPEAPVGIEPTNRGFADLCLTTWLRRRVMQGLNLPDPKPRVNPRTVRNCAAILPPQWSDLRKTPFVEFLYARATSKVRELASYAKRPKSNPYRAKVGDVIND